MSGSPLEPTIQTYLGMIRSNSPLQRSFRTQDSVEYRETESEDRSRYELVWDPSGLVRALFIKCIFENRLPKFVYKIYPREYDSDRVRLNVLSCRDPEVDINFMKRNLVSLKRLDIEQAAAVVVSAIVNDESILKQQKENLVKSLFASTSDSIFIDSCMWLSTEDKEEPISIKFPRFAIFTILILSLYDHGADITISNTEDWPTLLPTLLRIRRCRPKDKSRSLFIPPWIFSAANVNPPPNHIPTLHNYKPGKEPTDTSTITDPIVLTRHEFRSLQRRLNAYHQYWKPPLALRAAISDLSKSTLFNSTYIKRKILPSHDTLLVAHAFLSLQRRLQRKIVSDRQGVFLAKGASATFIQNTPWIPTRFEKVLELASHSEPTQERSVPITEPLPTSKRSAIPITGAALPQLDHCCLLMEEYVRLYSDGDRSNLCFHRGRSGGSGRGPVDDYNKLCDILVAVKEKAERELGKAVELGPVRKFLAKDVMHWNAGWADDAFAAGFEPGWVGWLEKRRRAGVLLSEWETRGVDLEEGMGLPVRLAENGYENVC